MDSSAVNTVAEILKPPNVYRAEGGRGGASAKTTEIRVNHRQRKCVHHNLSDQNLWHIREQRGHDEVGGRAFARRGINVCVWPHSVFAGGPTGLALCTVFRLLGYVEDHWTQDGPEKTGETKTGARMDEEI